MAKFLDQAGLQYLWQKLKEKLGGYVPTGRKVNGKALTSDINLSAADVSAIPASQKGAANGVAELDESGKVPSAQLPSYVDDALEGYLSGGKFYKESTHTTEITGESGKIYVDLATNKSYRWSGSGYVEISASLALGETSSTAYRGDRGKIAYEHSQEAHAPANAEANVQADWNESDPESDAFIKNKPTSMPANGGNAATVGGHTVEADVPENAVFTGHETGEHEGSYGRYSRFCRLCSGSCCRCSGEIPERGWNLADSSQYDIQRSDTVRERSDECGR